MWLIKNPRPLSVKNAENIYVLYEQDRKCHIFVRDFIEINCFNIRTLLHERVQGNYKTVSCLYRVKYMNRCGICLLNLINDSNCVCSAYTFNAHHNGRKLNVL